MPNGGDARSAARRGWRVWARYGAAAALPLALGVLAARLALAPIHGVSGEAACRRAVAAARTHEDTVSADLLTYADPSARAGKRSRRRRCGDLRTATVDLAPR